MNLILAAYVVIAMLVADRAALRFGASRWSRRLGRVVASALVAMAVFAPAGLVVLLAAALVALLELVAIAAG